MYCNPIFCWNCKTLIPVVVGTLPNHINSPCTTFSPSFYLLFTKLHHLQQLVCFDAHKIREKLGAITQAQRHAKNTREIFLFCKRFSILKVWDFACITDLDLSIFFTIFCIPSLVSRILLDHFYLWTYLKLGEPCKIIPSHK